MTASRIYKMDWDAPEGCRLDGYTDTHLVLMDKNGIEIHIPKELVEGFEEERRQWLLKKFA